MTAARSPARPGHASRPAFVDFLDLAVEAAQGATDQRVHGGEDVQATCTSLARVVTILRQYIQDPPRNVALFPAQKQPLSPHWERARHDARHALLQAGAWLCLPPAAPADTHGGDDPRWLAPRLNRAAQALTAGHDLLYTHFAQTPEGAWYPRSEWAETLASPQASKAMLAEVARVAAVIAPRGTRVALTHGWRGSPAAREKLTKACQWLWTLHASVQAASETEPIPAAHGDMLRAMTSSRLPERPQPESALTVLALCANATVAAERARRSAWRSGTEAAWSPALTITSLRLTAGSAVVISHNNDTVLRALVGTKSGQAPNTERDLLSSAATSAARARHAWLQVARALTGFTTDTRTQIGPVAAETSELALWTGRLTYTDPQWNPSRGTRASARAGTELAPDRAHLRGIVAAIHQASYTLGFLATAGQRQIQTAARSRRILVPVRSIPDTFDIRVPFTRAPEDRIWSLLDLYMSAEEASTQATCAAAELATEIDAPSRSLAAAAQITSHAPERSRPVGRGWTQIMADLHHADAGPIERMLRDLEIDDQDLLARAADLDDASQKLIVQASEQLEPGIMIRSAQEQATGAGTAALIDWSLVNRSRLKASSALAEAATQHEPEH